MRLLWKEGIRTVSRQTKVRTLVLFSAGISSVIGGVVEKIAVIVRGFNANWKKAMDEINAEVLRTFNNFKQGTNILQV